MLRWVSLRENYEVLFLLYLSTEIFVKAVRKISEYKVDRKGSFLHLKNGTKSHHTYKIMWKKTQLIFGALEKSILHIITKNKIELFTFLVFTNNKTDAHEIPPNIKFTMH